MTNLPLHYLPIAQLVHALEFVQNCLQRIAQRMSPPHFALLYEISGARQAQAVYTAAELGIADVLKNGPLTSGEIADLVGADKDAIERLMRLLCSRRIFKRKNNAYELTPIADGLRTDSPVSMRAWARLTGCQEHWEHWGHLVDTIRTGQPSVPELRGTSFFEYMTNQPKLGQIFNDAMTSISNMAITPLMIAYDFRRFRSIADIGGGHGALLAAMMNQATKANGLLLDLPQVVKGAVQTLDAAGVRDRCKIIGGSFFESVPSGFDAYVLKTVIHDWPMESARRILENIRTAIPTTGTLLLVEMVLPEDDSPHPGKLLDLDMMLTHGGRERTEDEYSKLLSSAGFRLNRIVPTVAPLSIVEATPIGR